MPGGGGVVVMFNVRWPPADITYISNHAQDRILIVDDVLLPLYEKFKGDCKVEKVIVVPLTGKPVPEGYENYETFIGKSTGDFQYPDLAATDPFWMCHTS